MKKFIYGLLFLLWPTLSWANTCEQTVLEKVANQLQSEVAGLPQSEAGFSADFREYDSLWRLSDARAAAQMPKSLLSVYNNYKLHFQNFNKIYNQNREDPTIANKYLCHQEFYVSDIFNALYGDFITPIEIECEDFITPEERRDLRRELSRENLANCKLQENNQDLKPLAESLPTAGRSTDVSPVPPARLELGQNRFSLFLDQEKRATTPIEINEEGFSVARVFKSLRSIFTLGGRGIENDNQSGDLRFGNVLANHEIDTATRARRSIWENDRNYWIERGIKSGNLLDMYQYRFESEILKTLKDTNDSLESSLKTIANICGRQDSKDTCWEGKNNFSSKYLKIPEIIVN